MFSPQIYVVELFEKSCIRAKGTEDVLMRVLDGPVTRHLPNDARVIGEFHGFS